MRVGDILWTVLILSLLLTLARAISVEERNTGVKIGEPQIFKLQPLRTVRICPDDYTCESLLEIEAANATNNSILFEGETVANITAKTFNFSFPEYAQVSNLSFSLSGLGGSYSQKTITETIQNQTESIELSHENFLEAVILKLGVAAKNVSIFSYGKKIYSRLWPYDSQRRYLVNITDASVDERILVNLNSSLSNYPRCTDSSATEIPCWENWTGNYHCSMGEMLDFRGDGCQSVNVKRPWQNYEPGFVANKVYATVCSYTANIQMHDLTCTLAGVTKSVSIDNSGSYICSTFTWDEQTVLDYVNNHPNDIILANCGTMGYNEFLPIFLDSNCRETVDTNNHFYDIRIGIDYTSKPDGISLVPVSGDDIYYVYDTNAPFLQSPTDYDYSSAVFDYFGTDYFLENQTFDLTDIALSTYEGNNSSSGFNVDFNVSGGYVDASVEANQTAAQNVSVYFNGELFWQNESVLYEPLNFSSGAVKRVEVAQNGNAGILLSNINYIFTYLGTNVTLGTNSFTTIPVLNKTVFVKYNETVISHNQVFPLIVNYTTNASRTFTANESIVKENYALQKSVLLESIVNASQRWFEFSIENNSTNLSSDVFFNQEGSLIYIFSNLSSFYFNWTVPLPKAIEVKKEESAPALSTEIKMLPDSSKVAFVSKITNDEPKVEIEVNPVTLTDEKKSLLVTSNRLKLMQDYITEGSVVLQNEDVVLNLSSNTSNASTVLHITNKTIPQKTFQKKSSKKVPALLALTVLSIALVYRKFYSE